MPDWIVIAAIVLAAACLVAVLSALVYSIWIEPARLTVYRAEIASPWLPPGFDGVRILQFSDTHIGTRLRANRLDRLLGAIAAESPDIVVFTGDLFDAARRNPERDRDLSPLLSRIEAPLGKFAVYGNHDFGYERTRRSHNPTLANAGFDILLNRTVRVSLTGGQSITVTGLDDWVLGRPEPRLLEKLRPDRFNLLLVHEPDVADMLLGYPIDLQLSGHSHGGQVKLPLAGALVRTKLGRKYLAGAHVLRSRRRPLKPYRLYVNRGIGTTRLRIRFGSVPELSVFTLRHADAEVAP